MAWQPARKLFTTTEYHKLIETGVLKEDDRFELVKGEIIEISPIGPRHAACGKRMNTLLGDKLRKRALISVQDPITLSDYSEPQPDLALLKRAMTFTPARTQRLMMRLSLSKSRIRRPRTTAGIKFRHTLSPVSTKSG